MSTSLRDAMTATPVAAHRIAPMAEQQWIGLPATQPASVAANPTLATKKGDLDRVLW